MECEFDRFIDRSGTESAKWGRYGPDVLPMWVADMDFLSPEPVIRAIRERVDHGIFGYPTELPELRPTVVARLEQRYGWEVDPDSLLFIPGVVRGFNLACHALTTPGDGVLLQTPIYHPMLSAADNASLTRDEMELTRMPDGQYGIDFGLMERTITERTRLFLLCNPHNPVGRVFERWELGRMAEICLRRDVFICSDEIHCELVFRGHPHLPIAALDKDISARTITLMAPSKTFNIAGLHFSVAIIEDEELRKRFRAAYRGLVPSVGVMGYVAALAAYRDGGAWLDEVMLYLEANRDETFRFVNEQLPGISMAKPEGTFLAWLDCRSADLPCEPHEFFLEKARVAMNDGAMFGRGGQGFTRLNFGCCRSMLDEALGRMRTALLA